MAPRSNDDRLRAAWRALASDGVAEGWRTIPIELEGECRLLGGRHFPGNEEAILVGFRGVPVPPANRLPKGHGFRVDKVAHGSLGQDFAWVSLSRELAGSLDMFAMMAGDIVGMLEVYAQTGQEPLFQLFLSRIRAWQDFMERDGSGVLTAEAEIGLYGELLVLRDILGARLPAALVLENWEGPLRGLHDFLIGTGAIEVKTTVGEKGFPALISSLEQLDASIRQPLFIVGIRLLIDGSGTTLPELAADLRRALHSDPVASGLFESRLVQAGLLETFADRYTRRFLHARTVVLPVDEKLPKLTRGNISIAIRKASYELDLDLTDAKEIDFQRAIEQLRGT